MAAFSVSIKTTELDTKGKSKPKTVKVLFEGVSYGDVEAKIAEEFKEDVAFIDKVVIAPYMVNNVYPNYPMAEDAVWYSGKLVYVDGKKKFTEVMLTNAASIGDAVKIFAEKNKGIVVDSENIKVERTQFSDVIGFGVERG